MGDGSELTERQLQTVQTAVLAVSGGGLCAMLADGWKGLILALYIGGALGYVHCRGGGWPL